MKRSSKLLAGCQAVGCALLIPWIFTAVLVWLFPGFSYGLVERWVCPANSSIQVQVPKGWLLAILSDDESVDFPQFTCVNSRGAVVLGGDSSDNTLVYTRVAGVVLLGFLPIYIFIIAFVLISDSARKRKKSWGDNQGGKFSTRAFLHVAGTSDDNHAQAGSMSSNMITRRARHSEKQDFDVSQVNVSLTEQKTSNYGVRLLISFGVVFLGFITIVSFGSLLLVIISSITFGATWTGNFWEDIFPFILLFAITGIGVFGIYKIRQRGLR